MSLVELIYKEDEPHYLNNFWVRLPDKRGQTIEDFEKNVIDPLSHSLTDYRAMVIQLGWLDKLIGEVESQNHPTYKYSDLYLSQTYREFFHQIDAVIEELDIEDPLKPIVYNYDEQKDYRRRVLIPIYRKLIEIGYSKRDLTQ